MQASWEKHRQKRLRPSTSVAFQIDERGSPSPIPPICRVCVVFNESMDELLAWKERCRGKMGGAK